MIVNKKDLKDVGFVMPVRIDSIARLENLLGCINHILKYFCTNIYVLEAACLNNHILERLLPASVSYIFVKDDDPIFHRTKYINVLAKMNTNPFFSIWDADIIIREKQIWEAVSLLREDGCDVAFPYNGFFYDTTQIIRQVYLQKEDISVLYDNIGKMILPYGTNMGGGALFIRKDKFLLAGGEDECFYGWGPEDWNRIEKWKKFDYRISKIDGPLFHLSHSRNQNGRINSVWQKRYAYNKLKRTQMGDIEEIRRNIKDSANN